MSQTFRPAARLVPLVMLLAGCTPPAGPPPLGDGPVKVTVTTSILADAVRQVGGDRAAVTALMPPGSDPHSYVPTAADAEALAGANLVLFHGLHLEGKMTDLLEHSATTRARAVAAALDPGEVRTVDGNAPDPHVWFDVTLWKKCVGRAADELAAIDPAHAGEYQANFARYGGELDALDADIRARVDSLPKSRRVLVTSHDAFGYFGRAYDFEVRGLQGVSTAFETGSGDVSELARFIKGRDLPAIFAETSTLPNGLRKVLESTPGVKLVGVGALEADALYTDSVGAPGTPTGTYAGAVRHNVNVLVKYLKP